MKKLLLIICLIFTLNSCKSQEKLNEKIFSSDTVYYYPNFSIVLDYFKGKTDLEIKTYDSSGIIKKIIFKNNKTNKIRVFKTKLLFEMGDKDNKFVKYTIEDKNPENKLYLGVYYNKRGEELSFGISYGINLIVFVVLKIDYKYL